jgi:hypothetical protein
MPRGIEHHRAPLLPTVPTGIPIGLDRIQFIGLEARLKIRFAVHGVTYGAS